MSRPFLEVENLTLRIGDKTIVSGLSFAMEAGEIRGVIGPNGAGKSTCIRCLAGVLSGWEGSIRYEGADMASLSRRRLARLVCYLPQTQAEAPAFSVWEYVTMARYAHLGVWGGLGAADVRIAERALEETGVAGYRDRLLSTLSGGERQMVAVAAGLAQEARLLVLDEPATFLDPLRQDMLLSLVARINRDRGVAVLMVTHDVNAAILYTDRILALREGGVAFDGPSRELASTETLRRVYGMDFAFAGLPGGGTYAVSEALARRGREAVWTR